MEFVERRMAQFSVTMTKKTLGVWLAGALLLLAFSTTGCRQNLKFDGLKMSLGNLPRLSDAETRSISPESFTGEKGKAGMATEGTGANAARELGQGWKISPSVRIEAGQTFVMADVQGSGAIDRKSVV